MNGAGAQRVMLNLAHGFCERGYSVDLVLVKAVGAYLQDLHKSVRVVDLDASRTLTSLPALARYLRNQQPTALLSAMNYANVIALLAWRWAKVQTRIVVSVHNNLSKDVVEATGPRGPVITYLIKYLYKWAYKVVTVSRGVAEDLCEVTGLASESTRVIYNPVVTPTLREGAKAGLTHSWFEKNRPPVLLAVGRLRPQKDFATLIKAFAQVRKKHAARLLILGEGPERPMLELLIKELKIEKDVSMPGFAHNPYAFMSRAALFILSSAWEGLGIVLVEALYCGTPVVSTDCESGPREILKDGEYGQLVSVGDVNAMARAIETVLADQSSSPPEESWYPFELQTVVSQYQEVLLGT